MSSHEYRGTQMRVISKVTFIPGDQEHEHHAIFSVLDVQQKDAIPIHAWGKRAVMAAHYLYKGKCVNLTGRITTYLRDTGYGDDKKHLQLEVHLTSLELLDDSLQHRMRGITEKLAEFFESASEEELKNPDIIKLGSELARNPHVTMESWDEDTVRTTGHFGHPDTKIWSKDKGFWEPEPQEVAFNVDEDGQVNLFIG